MSAHVPETDELRVVFTQRGFRAKALAEHVELDVRTLVKDAATCLLERSSARIVDAIGRRSEQCLVTVI